MRLRLVVGILIGVGLLEFFGDLPGEAYLLALALGALLLQPNSPAAFAEEVPPAIAMAEDDE